MPHYFIVKGDEGRAISRVDGKGYINASDDLADSGYVLFWGNFQSNGAQVAAEKRYISLLNEKFQRDNRDNIDKRHMPIIYLMVDMIFVTLCPDLRQRLKNSLILAQLFSK